MKRIVIALLAVFALSPLAEGESPSALDETRVTLRSHVLRLINKDRKLYGLPPVELDIQASAIGDEYTRTQLRNRTMGHFTVDGLAPYTRYSLAGGNDGVSENAAAWSANYHFSDRALFEMARRSQDAMMAEMPPHDGHKRTILDRHATHVGIGLAWERGEFRLVQEFIRRYVDWTRPLPRSARLEEEVIAAGRPLPGVQVQAISVHYERFPQSMPAHVANAIQSYSLPAVRRDFRPRLKVRSRTHPNGTVEVVREQYDDGSTGDFYVSERGAFTFNVPFEHGPGIYTVVVWVRQDGASRPIAASNVSIRVEKSEYTFAGTR